MIVLGPVDYQSVDMATLLSESLEKVQEFKVIEPESLRNYRHLRIEATLYSDTLLLLFSHEVGARKDFLHR